MEETIQEETIEETPDEQVNEEIDNEIAEEVGEPDGAEDNESNQEQESDGEQEAVEETKEIDPDSYEIELRGTDESPIEFGEDIDPDDAKTIGTIVEKQTASMKAKLQETQDRLEVDNYVQSNPEYAPYKDVALKYLKNEVYSKIPVKNIMAMVAHNDLLKLGAKQEREAQAKADSTKVNKGTTPRPTAGGAMDWTKAPKDAFEQKLREVKGHRA